MNRRYYSVAAWAVLLCLAGPAVADHPEREMAAAAHTFLASLNEEERALTVFEFGDEERLNWHFIPKERRGLPLSKMSEDQKSLAYALLATGLSRKGQVKALTVMSLERILRLTEGPDRRFSRDPALYHVSVFGQPSPAGTWGWRFEGHHLSVNFVIVKGQLASGTPSFYGSNPAHVKSGPRRGLRALAEEEDIARALVRSLNPEQLKIALVRKEAPRDIFSGSQRKVDPLKHKGLPSTALNWHQRELLMQIIHEYVFRSRTELAHRDLHKIKQAGIEKIHFAWMGSLEPDKPHYYSIQGPTFLLEYDNIQNNANHVHTAWRDFENDFGIDTLRHHYENSPHH